MIRLEPNRLIGMLVMPMLSLGKDHVRPTQPNAQEDVQHRPAEASRQRHDGKSEARDCNVCNEVAETVTHSEDGESKDRVRHIQDDA